MDTEGFMLKAKVHSAKLMNYEGIEKPLQHAGGTCPRLKHLWLELATGDRGKEWVEKTLGWTVKLVERRRKPAPKEVLIAWAQKWLHEGEKVDWERLLPSKGFVVLPRRWKVERSFV